MVHSRFSHCAVLLGIREQRKVFGLCFVTAVHAGSSVVCFQRCGVRRRNSRSSVGFRAAISSTGQEGSELEA